MNKNFGFQLATEHNATRMTALSVTEVIRLYMVHMVTVVGEKGKEKKSKANMELVTACLHPGRYTGACWARHIRLCRHTLRAAATGQCT